MIYNLIKAELYMMFVLQIHFSCAPFMSLSIRVQLSSLVILVIFDNEGHRNWLQCNCGLFSLYLNCAKLFSHCEEGSSSDLCFLFPWQGALAV